MEHILPLLLSGQRRNERGAGDAGSGFSSVMAVTGSIMVSLTVVSIRFRDGRDDA
jgi:hypothetical protein